MCRGRGDVGGVGFHEVGGKALAALDHLVGGGARRALPPTIMLREA